MSKPANESRYAAIKNTADDFNMISFILIPAKLRKKFQNQNKLVTVDSAEFWSAAGTLAKKSNPVKVSIASMVVV